MKTRDGRLAVMMTLPMLLGISSCGEADNTHTWTLDASSGWPAMT